MHYFNMKNGELFAEEIPVAQLVEQFGTPLYIYSARTFREHFQTFAAAFKDIPHLTCFSVKACSNLMILKLLQDLGAGMDIVSGGELHRALLAGVSPKYIVYSGVGKTQAEIEKSIDVGILMFNVESVGELECLSKIAAAKGTKVKISLRVNPDVDPKTHPYISTGLQENKFGLDIESALAAYKLAKDLPGIELAGIDCHIGSQLTTLEPFLEALNKVLNFKSAVEDLGIKIHYLDLGGGLGITYDNETPPHPEQFGKAVSEMLKGHDLTLVLEPGRVIAGNAGIMVTKVLYVKETPSKTFVIVDAAMNDLVRPSLYGSYHTIAEVSPKGRPPVTVDVVGPICESGDFLAQDRALPGMAEGESLAIFSSGAYGFTMSSNYNSRPRAAEVLVDGEKVFLARRRETYEDLVALEKGLLDSFS